MKFERFELRLNMINYIKDIRYFIFNKEKRFVLLKVIKRRFHTKFTSWLGQLLGHLF